MNRIIGIEIRKLHEVYFKKSLGISAFIATSVVSRKEIYKINKIHRDKSKSTDILSFPSILTLEEHQKALKEQYLNQIIYKKHDPIQFGHIIICPDVISSRISRNSRSNSRIVMISKIRKLLIHAFAHLCNFDHHTNSEHFEMRRFELELLSKVMNNFKK
jgi:rRNA maturation RNase YbeY